MDPDYQSLNLFVPVSWGEKIFDPSGAPIILQNRCGGYAGSINRGEKKAQTGHSRPIRQPMPDDPRIGPARGQEGRGSVNEDDYVRAALASGFVVAVPGNRGRDCQFPDGRYYGKAPAMIADLKAAVRYLRHNSGILPGDTEHIISKGASAGGGLSALLSISGNDAAYAPYLADIGAADGRDDVYAGICISPVLDLEHQDSGYEWQYGRLPLYGFDGHPKPPVNQALSAQLSAQYEDYLRSLRLTCRGNWGALTPETYRDYYLKEFLLPSADRWLQAQDSETKRVYLEDRPWIHWDGKHVSFAFADYEDYLGRLKGLPPFDSFELGRSENSVFGTETENARHFTEFSLRHTSDDPDAVLSPDILLLRDLMNPMTRLRRDTGAKAAHWWIRMGAKECGFACPIVVSLATALENKNYDVNFRLVWDGGHCAEDDIDAQLAWVHAITGYQL